jgi:hypothetical protein
VAPHIEWSARPLHRRSKAVSQPGGVWLAHDTMSPLEPSSPCCARLCGSHDTAAPLASSANAGAIQAEINKMYAVTVVASAAEQHLWQQPLPIATPRRALILRLIRPFFVARATTL